MLAAAQGVCGNDTARAAEIPPPPDIGWKVEQLVRDNQWRSIAARRRRPGVCARRGRGSAAIRGGGPVAEVKKHTGLQKGILGSHGYTTVQGGITMGYHITK